MTATLEGTETARELGTDEPVLSVRDVVQIFKIERRGGSTGGMLHAVDGVSFDLAVGETVGIVGETGCGKTSLARSIMQLPGPTSGSIRVQGVELVGLKHNALREARRHIQMVFQDPYSSLDPKWRIADLIQEPLVVHKIGTPQEQEQRARDLLDLVGLHPTLVGDRKPREVSGGQCQRVAIARALALNPEVLILDESVSSLDVSVQAQVINLLEDLRDEFDLSYVFIAHDLSVVKHVSDRVAVMYLGKFAEVGPSDELYMTPHHPYTAALMGSIPGTPSAEALSPESIEALGEMPSPLEPPSGCRFRTRCSQAQERCAADEPQLQEVSPGRHVACHFPINLGMPRRTPAATAEANA
jgi:oligopeptide transport system ATP-binding protein